MLALTLRHPWPFAILRLGKDVENRFWQPTPTQLPVGDWFAIHGGVKPASDAKLRATVGQAHALIQRFQPELDRKILSWNEVILTGLVAIARFDGSVADHPSPWFERIDGNFAWTWSELFVLPEPIPCPGAQGLWKVPEEHVAAIRGQWRATRGKSS